MAVWWTSSLDYSLLYVSVETSLQTYIYLMATFFFDHFWRWIILFSVSAGNLGFLGHFVENKILRFGTTPSSPREYFELRTPSKVCRRVGTEKLPKLIDFLSWWSVQAVLTQFDTAVIPTDKPLASLRK